MPMADFARKALRLFRCDALGAVGVIIQSRVLGNMAAVKKIAPKCSGHLACMGEYPCGLAGLEDRASFIAPYSSRSFQQFDGARLQRRPF
jgi:hypothetical protein